MIKRSITLLTTQRCNEKCEYCDFPLIKTPKNLDLDIYLKYIDTIQDHYSMISFTGGEIGLLDEKTLDVMFEKLKFAVRVNTNGLFVDKGYYKKYKDKIRVLWYHIVREGVQELTDDKIIYTIVEHKENKEEVSYLLDRYRNLNIVISRYALKDKTKTNLLLQNNYIKPEIGCFVNTKMLDLVKGDFLYCCESYTQAPRANLDKITLEEFFDQPKAPDYDLCNSCTKMQKYRILNVRRRVGYGKV